MACNQHLEEFLNSIYTSHDRTAATNSRPHHRPFVTLTWAQSLDGKIAGPSGHQVRLSGEESMFLTHRLRARHSSILVGVNTMMSDDPQLSGAS